MRRERVLTDKQKRRILLYMFGLMIVSFIISLAIGGMNIPIPDVIRVLFTPEESKYSVVIRSVRLPRALIALLVGMCLSVSGVMMQGFTRNPMASPSMLGVTNGASLVTFVMFIFFPTAFKWTPIASFIGALGVTFMIYFMAWKGGIQPTRFILSGVAIGSVCSAIHSLLSSMYPDAVVGMIGFNVGSLSGRTWNHFFMMLPYAVVGLTLALLLSGKINLLLMGDEVATGLGIQVEKIRMVLIVVAALLAASAVSVAGLISFVGLCVPHITRMQIGSDYRYLLPACALNGATVLALCDTLARVIILPQEMSVGIILSAIGAPFFLHLLRKQSRVWG